MKLSKNFKLSEFTDSVTAKQNQIDNTPPSKAVANLRTLVRELLQPLRDIYGKAMNINSGYRCEALNKIVPNASATSDHMTGRSADVRCDNPTALLDALLHSGLEFDQAILYPTFLHLSYREGVNRKMVIRK